MRFGISKEVFDLFPDFCVGVVVAVGLNNRDGSAAAELQQAVMEARDSLVHLPLADDPSQKAWAAAFARLGIDHERFPNAAEALLRRVGEGEQIPSINPAVDLGNTVSLRYRLPVGAHDLDRLHGDFVVRVSGGGDAFTPMGETESEPVPAGEVVYADAAEVRTRRWVWRLGERAKVTAASQNIFFPIDGFVGVNDEAVRQAAADLASLVEQHLGAQVTTFFLDRANPTVDLPASVRREPDAVERLLTRGVAEAIPFEDMERYLRAGGKIRIYIGIDPTSRVIHLGHAVALRKLREFQRLGHKVVFLIGDFTGRIGDPTDKSAMRVQLTAEQVVENATSYIEQAGKILDIDSPTNPIEIRYNGEWWDSLTARDMIELAANFTVQQMIQRDMFQRRLEENKPIGLHEFLYPLLQGYDSVALDVNAEIGGTDQTFNMLAGRTLLRALKDKEKFVVSVPLLEGTDGRKMSKSFGNVIGVDDPPYEMYGRLMSLKDELIPRYFELCTDVSALELAQIERELAGQTVNPMALKKRLARHIVAFYHSAEAAREAEARFEREVQQGELPEEMPTVSLSHGGSWPVVDLLLALNLATSRGEARRLIQQGSVQTDGVRVEDPRATVAVSDGMVVRSRRRDFARVSLG
ncbi:MAG: tyrosine--tRNA ligase [Dehalococcoidales bacterium]|nr:tyrosine--tRNA ligase [Dehalococcoidales bacterium]